MLHFLARQKVSLRCSNINMLATLPHLFMHQGRHWGQTLEGGKSRVAFPSDIQGQAKRHFPGLVNYVTALAYHFCLALPAAFSQPGDRPLAEPCTPEGTDTPPAF